VKSACGGRICKRRARKRGEEKVRWRHLVQTLGSVKYAVDGEKPTHGSVTEPLKGEGIRDHLEDSASREGAGTSEKRDARIEILDQCWREKEEQDKSTVFFGRINR